jgi:putative DNA primase/helicase
MIRAATDDYKREMDPLGTFFEDECVTGDSHWVAAAELYRAYRVWTEREGVRFPLTKNALGLKVTERGFPARRVAQGARGYQGFRLRIR